MNPTGYSGKSLSAKLGLKPQMRVHFIDAPPTYFPLIMDVLSDICVQPDLQPPLDMIHCFVTKKRMLAEMLPAMQAALVPTGMLWISWPKKSARIAGDLDENAIRAIVLPTGLVDVKVCAIDAVWSGLKCVLRRELRPA
jgi:hypothetical protein